MAARIYAVIGTSETTFVADGIDYKPRDNEILMSAPKPTGNYIANDKAQWVKDISKEIAELDAKYTSLNKELCQRFMDDTLHNDETAIEADREEAAKLDAWYDEEYKRIQSEE